MRGWLKSKGNAGGTSLRGTGGNLLGKAGGRFLPRKLASWSARQADGARANGVGQIYGLRESATLHCGLGRRGETKGAMCEGCDGKASIAQKMRCPDRAIRGDFVSFGANGHGTQPHNGRQMRIERARFKAKRVDRDDRCL